MTSYDDGLDRRLTARLDERAAPRAPDGLSEAITGHIEATRQRPAWATTERWISMETRAQLGAVPRALIVFATLALLTLVVATAIAIGASNPPRLPAPFGAAGNGLIAFVSGGDVYVVAPDGSGLTAIASGPEDEFLPTWSRDGRRLAYWSGPEGGPTDLVVVEADGSNAMTVATTTGRPVSAIEWSVDGTEIMYDAVVPELVVTDVFFCEGDDAAEWCGSRLFVTPADGSGPPRQVGDPELTARNPALSPDGHTVVFGGGGAAGGEALHLMEWDGSDVRRLETGIGADQVWGFSGQSWSPSGDRIVTHTGMGQVVVDLDDSGSFESAARLRPGYFPVYAPAGDVINDGDGIIYADSEGEQSVELARFTGRWSPDASQLVRVADGKLEVYDRDTDEVIVIGTVEPTPSLTGYFTAEPERAYPSWQRVAP